MERISEVSDQIPIIGICGALKRDRIPGKIFKEMKRRLVHLKTSVKKKAIFVLFTLEDLNAETMQMEGYRYDESKQGDVWKKGVFPYPHSIFARCGIPLGSARDIEKIIGCKVFNTINFNKWEEWCSLNPDPKLQKHMPDTGLVSGPGMINDYLKKYNCIFLKPVIGSTSNGVIRAKYVDESIDVVCTLNFETLRKKFATTEDLWFWIRTEVSNAPYVVQQRIRTVKWKKKLTGIRLNIAKDESGKWKNCLLIGLRVLNGSHVAYSRGYDPAEVMIEIDSLLMELQKKGIHNVKQLKKSIVQLGMDIGHFFDRSDYHVADLGIDLGIDDEGEIWIFEVNRRPYPFYNFPVYDKSITAPLEYAIHLVSQ